MNSTCVPEEMQRPEQTQDKDLNGIDLTWSDTTELTVDCKEWCSHTAWCVVRARRWTNV